MDIIHIADSIAKGVYITMWFIGAGVVSIGISQIPFVKNWFKEISE